MTNRSQNLLLTTGLLAIAIAAYVPSLGHGYIWDDDLWLTENPLMHDGHGLAKIWTDPNAVPEYYPLTLTTFWIEHQLWDLAPLGYHLDNILLHAMNAVLLWILLRQLKVPGAFLAAAIFAVHPVQVESVSWVTERKNVLSGFFYLLSFILFMRFSFSERPRKADLVLSIIAFALAMLAKSVVVTLPAAMLVVVWWKRGRLTVRDFLLALPYFVLVIPFTFVSLWMQKHHTAAVGRAWDFNFVDRCLIAGRALWFYASKIVWPIDLLFIYPRWTIDRHDASQYFLPIAAIAVLIALWLLRNRLGRGPIAGVLFFAGTLFPALGFLNIYWQQYSFVADHMQYIACIGLIVLIAAGLHQINLRINIFNLHFAILIPLLLLTWLQQPMYANSIALWQTTIPKNPTSWMTYTNLGHAYLKQNNFPAAFEQYQLALSADASVPETHRNVGVVYAMLGKFDDAIAEFSRSAEIDPTFVRAFNDRGKAYLAQNKIDPALADFRHAVELQPYFPEANFNLARALERSGNVTEAAEYYQRALDLQPDLNDARPALQRLGRP